MAVKSLEERPENFCIEDDLLAADASRNFKAAPGAGKAIVVTRMILTSVTSAAQAATVTIGNVIVARIPASFDVGGQIRLKLEKGLTGDENQPLTITPAAAGPAFHVIFEGYVRTLPSV